MGSSSRKKITVKSWVTTQQPTTAEKKFNPKKIQQ
jgi:hypothetical protein